jgi:hypothetical protein
MLPVWAWGALGTCGAARYTGGLAEALVGQADLRQALADVWIAGAIAPDVPGDLIFEGCGDGVRVPFVAHSLAAPQVTATRQAESADVSWSLLAGATATVTGTRPTGRSCPTCARRLMTKPH